MKERQAIIALVSLVVLLAGIIIFLLQSRSGSMVSVAETPCSIPDPAAPLIAPAVSCGVKEGVTIGERIALKTAIEDQISDAQKSHYLSEAAVYFRDLNNGPWFGINESEDFLPASLMKVPLAFWFYKQEDHNPGYLGEEIQFTGPKGVSEQVYKPKEDVVPGMVYTLHDLVRLMLTESSNDAASILSQYAGLDNRNTVFKDLDLPLLDANKDYLIDVHTYAGFLRSLYNATYLSRASSNQFLATLAASSFRDGIVKGVPDGVVVAHKFGEYPQHNGEVQLHDCGIVYVPGHPYILCVMTRGKSFPDLSNFVAAVSHTVYQGVTAK